MVLRRGAKGEVVGQLQQKLREHGLYQGRIDDDFGGGTERAVRKYQEQQGLAATGEVDDAMWGALFGGAAMPKPEILGKPLAQRCLALTGAFETSSAPPECFCGLSGDFDGQGISFGALQWCLGQRSLQPLLLRVVEEHPGVAADIFADLEDELRAMLAADFDDQMRWARSIQGERGRVGEPWRGMFKTLGRTPEFQSIQVDAAARLFRDALDWCERFDVRSERAVALMFDIRVQNGSISQLVEAQIRQDFRAMNGGTDETPKLRAIAERRAAVAKPQWVADVRKRKLAIAEGGGVVHGAFFDLEQQYGITLAAAAP